MTIIYQSDLELVPLHQFQPMGPKPMINGWQPGQYYTAFLVPEDAWGAVVALDDAHTMCMVGGINCTPQYVEEMEQGPVPELPRLYFWVCTEDREASLREMMRHWEHRCRISQAKFCPPDIPDFSQDEDLYFTRIQMQAKAEARLEQVYRFWADRS